MRTFLRALLRAVVIGLLPLLLFVVLYARVYEENGANIGGGMLVLAIALVGSFVWARRDGRVGADRSPLALWALVAALTFVLQAVTTIADSGVPTDPDNWSVITADAAFLATLVLVGGGAGALIGARQHRP